MQPDRHLVYRNQPISNLNALPNDSILSNSLGSFRRFLTSTMIVSASHNSGESEEKLYKGSGIND